MSVSTVSHSKSIVKKRNIIALAIFVFIFGWEFIIVHRYGDFNVTYYDELADAFLHGQTYLLRDPPAEMMALKDPWDPNENVPYRYVSFPAGTRYPGVHDLALFNGRLYLQWGPLPALLLIPLRMIAGHDLPMGIVVLLVAFAAAFSYGISAWKLARLAGIRAVFPGALLPLLFLLCPSWTFNLHRIAVYETGIFFAQLFMGLSLLSLVSAFEGRLLRGIDRPWPLGPWLLGLSSLCLGLMLSCRFTLCLIGLLLPVMLFLWWKTGPQRSLLKDLVIPGLLLAVPAASCLIANLIYNDHRFGNVLEAGQNWLLWGGYESMLTKTFHLMDIGRLSPNIWYYFFSPMGFSFYTIPLAIPLQVFPHTWMQGEQLKNYYDYTEMVTGLFFSIPLTVLTFFVPLFFVKIRSVYNVVGNVLSTQGAQRLRIIVPLLLLSGILVGLPLFFATATMRYESEWCMWWVMAGYLLAVKIRDSLSRMNLPAAKILFDIALTAAVGWSAWVGFSYTLIIN